MWMITQEVSLEFCYFSIVPQNPRAVFDLTEVEPGNLLPISAQHPPHFRVRPYTREIASPIDAGEKPMAAAHILGIASKSTVVTAVLHSHSQLPHFQARYGAT
ncbi:hypothetical protein ASG43_17470 [Aureimonas sp. Leaf454]|nr:hypothetical protein ASG43_17470 [Aureimonas sp. Leaf454]